MVDRTREQLLGYLFGALEESERESVANQLAQDPDLRGELVRLRQHLQPLWAAQPDFVPPNGLAKRTCQLVESYPPPCGASGTDGATTPGAPGKEPAGACSQGEPILPAVEAEGGGSHRSWMDVAVAGLLAVAVALVVFPAIQNSRFNARLAKCQDQLRQLGFALTQYSQKHEDYFPPVYDEGQCAGAGIYGPVLVTLEFVDDSRLFVCPGSPLAENRHFRVPRLEELLAAHGEELARLQECMGGSFGYSLGYLDDGVYTTRNLRRPHFALGGDKPSRSPAGLQSVNHDGRGQNVLFEDGRVMFCATARPSALADDVFVNEVGRVAAGVNRNDAVIAPSRATPCLCVPASTAGSRW